jgi:hypothetical protein
MPKARRKACSTKRVNPSQLLEMFHEKFGGKGISPYEFDCLGPKFQSDLDKVQFDFENYSYDHEEFGAECSILGPRTFWTRSPLTQFSLIGWSAGGDWEYPIKFIVYLDQDGKTFRAYIPKEGNVWNYKDKAAIGNDEDTDCEFLEAWVKKNKPELIDPTWEATDKWDKQFTMDDAGIMFDPQKIVHEMMFRFEAI